MDILKEVIKEEIPADCKKAVFAPGCFWCMEAIFEKTKGVLGAINGYAGGTTVDPNYEKVCQQTTDHREAVLVYYSEKDINFKELLTIFFNNIDPTQTNGQFNDYGFSYTTAIFYRDESEKDIALQFIKDLKIKKIFTSIATKVISYSTFYQAENYHQNFYLKNPQQYAKYYKTSGRIDYQNCKTCQINASEF